MKNKPRKQPAINQDRLSTSYYGLMALAAGLYAALNPLDRTGILNDDAVYVLGARSLWGGAFKSLIVKPDYPMPGLPILLAPFIKIVEPHWTRLEWLSVAATLVTVFYLVKWSRRFLSQTEAFLATLLFVINPIVARCSGILVAGTFYAPGVIASYWLMQQWLEKPSRANALRLGFVLGWASLVRPEGVLLLISVVAALVVTRKANRTLLAMIFPIAFWGLAFCGWWYYQRQARTEYGGDWSALISFWTRHPIEGLQFLKELILDFLINPLAAVELNGSYWSPRVLVTMLGFSGLIGLGYYNLYKTHQAHRSLFLSLGMFCALYFGVHLLWHVSEMRYALPLLPFLFACLVHGLFFAFNRFRWGRAVSMALISLLVLAYAQKDFYAIRETYWMKNSMNRPAWRTLTWISQNTSPQDKILSDVAPGVELYANRQALGGIVADNIELFIYQLYQGGFSHIYFRNRTYLSAQVKGTIDPNRQWGWVQRRLVNYPRLFQLEFEDPEDRTQVYRVLYSVDYADAYALWQSAQKMYLSKNYNEADRLVRESLAKYPNLGSAMNLLAALSWQRGDMNQAGSLFQKAADLLPTSWIIPINLATLYQQKGLKERSEEYLRKAQQLAQEDGHLGLLEPKIAELRQQWSTHYAEIQLFPI